MDSKTKILITEDKNEFNSDELSSILAMGYIPVFCKKDGEEVINKILTE